MDREKVIKAFEICDNNDDGIVCKNCPYKEDKWNGAWEDETGKTCFQTLHADVLALLKEQEEREKAICKEICDFIRGACSTDTDDDKEFVCYEIQRCFTHFGRSVKLE